MGFERETEQVKELAKNFLARELRTDKDYYKFAASSSMESFFREIFPMLVDEGSWEEVLRTTGPATPKEAVLLGLAEAWPSQDWDEFAGDDSLTLEERSFAPLVVGRYLLIRDILAEAILSSKKLQSLALPFTRD